MQFAQGVAAPAEAPEVLGRAFVDACVATWDRQGPPATRTDINQAFSAWCEARGKRSSPNEAFRGILESQNSATRYKARHQGRDYAVYKRCVPSATPGFSMAEVVTLRPGQNAAR